MGADCRTAACDGVCEDGDGTGALTSAAGAPDVGGGMADAATSVAVGGADPTAWTGACGVAIGPLAELRP